MAADEAIALQLLRLLLEGRGEGRPPGLRPLAQDRVLPEAEYLHLFGMLLQVRCCLEDAEARHGRRRVALLGSAVCACFGLRDDWREISW